MNPESEGALENSTAVLAWWHTPAVSALRRQKQEGCKFKASLTT